ncbi:MAG: SpoIIE family protein phosphatase [Crocinitomix sp.]|nr:SpoIIE family protein phosphatase [Crocinitomix sp.]
MSMLKNTLLLLTLFFLVAAKSQVSEWIFDRQTIKDGLSNTHITDIIKDSKGFIWVATRNGLNKYDAYSYQIFKNDPRDSTSISSDIINCIYEDRKGNLWIGTNNGLNLYDRSIGEFVYWQSDTTKNKFSSPSHVSQIVEGSNGVLWLGSQYNSVIEFDPEKNTFKTLSPLNMINEDFHELWVRALLIDRNKNLWIGTNGNGIVKYNLDSKEMIMYANDLDKKHPSELAYTFALYEDQNGTIWAGTYLGGLAVYEPQNENFRVIPNPNNPEATVKNGIMVINQIKTGELLLGSNGGGLYIFDEKTEQFKKNYHFNPVDQNSISDDFVGELFVDESGIVWIGTENGGISIHDPNARKFNLFKKRGNTASDLSGNVVNALYEDESGRIWIGTENNGFASYDRKTNLYKKYVVQSAQVVGGNTFVKDIISDGNGNMWIATTMGGLAKADTNGVILEQYSPFIEGSGDIKQHDIFTLALDQQNQLWFGGASSIEKKKDDVFSIYCRRTINSESSCQEPINTIYPFDKNHLLVGTIRNGFYFFNTQDNTLKATYNTDNSDLSHNSVNSFCLDSKNRLWIATGKGLNQFHFEDSTTTVLFKSDGLPDNNIHGILEGDNGNLWISTSFGLCCFNPDKMSFQNYYESDGLQSNVFRNGAHFKSKSGELFFGGVGGFNSFFPDDITTNPNPPPIVFTDIQVFNESFKRGDIPSIEVLIEEASIVKLNYDESIFSFEFAALNYTLAEENEYAYMLEGFNDDWQYIGKRRFITFTNLSPGSYTLKVKACNNDGLWNEEGISLKIVVMPPFWETWWFRISVMLLILILIYLIYKWRIRSIERQNKVLEKQVKLRTQQVVQQKNEIEDQKDLVEQKNNDITASIRYSKRIQESFLPNIAELETYFASAFVLYKPKDIVSGDFYWIEASKDKENVFISVADCTGHGVPGAMVSVLGNNGLNRSVNELHMEKPNEILDNLNSFVQKAFDKKDSNVQDGMDISLCSVNIKNKTLDFAGANNPVWIVRNNEIHIIKGTKQPIGNYHKTQAFELNQYQLEKGDWVFLFSDGFADQFGGPKGKKYKYTQLKTKLLSYIQNPEGSFEAFLENEFKIWKGDYEQVDDVCLLGFQMA